MKPSAEKIRRINGECLRKKRYSGRSEAERVACKALEQRRVNLFVYFLPALLGAPPD